jgi:hypothetical protein
MSDKTYAYQWENLFWKLSPGSSADNETLKKTDPAYELDWLCGILTNDGFQYQR